MWKLLAAGPALSVLLSLAPPGIAPASAEVAFSDPILIADGNVDGAVQAAAADLDGDGDLDVVSASFLDRKVAWYENVDGHGAFGPQQVITDIASPSSVFPADLDGDGDVDLVFTTYLDGTVAWCENTDGLGAFGPPRVISSVVDYAFYVATADLDGDGDLDLVACANEGDAVMWFRSKLASAVPAGTPTGYRLHPCVPNPFNPRTTIAYELPAPARVILRIHAPDGRLVRTLVPGRPMPAGSHQATWTGLDAAGRPAASGVYLCRLEAGPFRETRRMTLLR